jgi:glycosyltransferase involved in cell wall biosynthesis
LSSETPLLSILAPAYNEGESIEKVILNWEDVISREGLEAEIIIVNDGSTDQTGEILDRLMGDFSNLNVITFSQNQGLGAALRDAIAHASGQYALTIDADGQFDLGDYKPLMKMLFDKNLDAVTGWREGKKDKLLLIAADRMLNMFVRVLFRVPFRDTNCALKIYSMGLLRNTPLKGDGWSAPTELLIRAHKGGARVGEMPVRHYARPAGESKLHPVKVSIRFLLFIFSLKLELAFSKNAIIRQGGTPEDGG